MLNSLRRWLGREPSAPYADVAVWAVDAGHVFKLARSGDGFAVESVATAGRPAWRLEWGPSQRAYIEGQELRLRAELPGGDDVQMLVLSRALLARLEAQTFRSFTDSLKTYADDSAPEEMRWLAMYPRVEAPPLAGLRAHFGAVASDPDRASRWLSGPLADALAGAVAEERPGADAPMQLMVHRSRLTLRMPLGEPQVPVLQGRVALFEVALASALETPARP